ncbi:iron ABC transporter substrate-binding protein [Mycolicibacterium agri]|uniref:Iron ABC transporter substrate-binding protein n=1 Tax=Mycolicibacterium agri TaxID=36811 RepID=A0A2A7NCA9_MYCAG|nr:ABC transporter substrate-binding protein [Mycolicibacterium agri]PEG41466.1 iron ABC transporter substrate-binding protein [Mycolicibacterium agri]
MPKVWSRRRFLALSATVATLAAACSKEEPGAVARDGSVTVKHAFGETKVPGPPQRVVSAGLTGQDDLLAVGIVPIAVTNWFGDQPFGVWPWAQPKLGQAQPEVLDLGGGIQIDRIAALKPDLIVATNAGVDQETYDKLTEIAPTIPQSGQDAFFEPWKKQAAAISQAVFKYDEMAAIVKGIEDKFSAVADNNPQFSGKNALLLEGTLSGDAAHVLNPDWRSEFLTQMGFTIPDTGGSVITRDRMESVLGQADVLIWTTEGDDQQGALLADPVITKLEQRNVFTGKDLAGAIAFSSPLSLPVVADQLPPMLTRALG